jgi:Transmembrane secretion effector
VFTLPSSPRLRRILTAYTVNQLGTWFGYFALSLGIYDHTHSALAVAGMFVAARGLPALLAPALVASTELFGGRGALSRLYMVEALTALALAALLWHFWLPGLLLLVAIDGTAALAASALLRATGAHVAAEEIEASSIPARPEQALRGDAPGGASGELDREHEVEVAQRSVNAAFNFAFTGTLAIVPLIAGVVVAMAGTPTALLIDAATFMVCAALLGNVRPHAEDADGTSVRARLLAAWRYLNEMPQLRSLLLTEAVAVVFFASVEPVEVLYAKQTLAVGDRGFGLLVDVWGVGMVLGSIVFARAVRRPLGPMLVLGTLLVGLAYLGFAVAPTLPIACAAALVGGAGNGAQWPSLISAVQQLTPTELHGRLMSAVESIGSLCPAIGFVLGGVITALSSPRVAMLVAGVAATAITGLFLRIASHSFRIDPRGETVGPDIPSPQLEGSQVRLDVGR